MSLHNTAAVCPRYAALCALALILPLSASLASAATAPTISGKPATSVVVSHRYSFQPRAGGSAGKRTFSITHKPWWANFRPETGELYGTPHHVGTFRGVDICVHDAGMKRCLPSFNLKVVDASTVLVIRGTPAATAMVGSAYSFQPTAHDPDGLKITFSVVDKPAWLRFDGASGKLSGTPSAADVRDYPDIDIVASNGRRTARLRSFSITVDSQGSQLPPANVTIAWTPPTENTNGSTLTNLAGYHLYYGTTASNLTEVVDITNPGVASYMVSDLAAGTWYFALTSVNSAGEESERSSVISTVVE